MSASADPQQLPSDVSRRVAKALEGLAYGSVQLVVHDGRVIQIERVERIRLSGRLTGHPEAFDTQHVVDPTATTEARPDEDHG